MTPLAIAATGACTPIGTRAWQTASVLAAKQSAFTRVQLPDHIDHLATVSRVSAIPSDETGTDRLIRLAAPALAEAMPSDTRTHTSRQPIMLFLAVPSSMQELPLHCDPQRIALELPRALDLAAEYLPMRIFQGSAAAGADALAAAYQFMHANLRVNQVLVGGVDSLCDTPVAHALYRRGWLKVNRYTEGFIASEGAAFVRLCRRPPDGEYATVYPPGFAAEHHSRVGSQDLLDGRALIQCVQHAVDAAQFPVDALHAYWCDADGSAWRGSEAASLGAALASQGGLPPAQEPAAFLGEMGAAWAPLMLSLFHEMRQSRHHPFMPHGNAGHAALQSVSGHDERVAAWVCTWS